MSVKIIEIDKYNNNRRLDNYLISIFKNIPKSKIYKIIRKGEVRINSKRAKAKTKIKTGDLIRIPPMIEDYEKLDKKIPTHYMDMLEKRIVFENKNYIIIDKPSGIAVHSGTKNPLTVIEIMRSLLNSELDLCHRIDKETSGCLVLSKNKLANRYFNKISIANKIEKKYLAILKGHLKSKIKLNDSIKSKSTGKKKSYISDAGKDSISFFKPIKRLTKSTLVEIEIFTGRTHQIRLQSSNINHPVINDNKYGDHKFNKLNLINNIKRMALHSYKLNFKDEGGILIDIKIEPDDDFMKLVESY